MLVYRRRIYLICLVVLFFLLDRGGKTWVQNHLAAGESLRLFPDVFHITFVHNSGAAFSMFQQYPIALLILTSVLFAIFLLYSLSRKLLSLWEVYALSLILGGALGNISDRLTVGRVIDYLDFVLIDYPIFNLADVFIFLGITLLLIHYVLQNRQDTVKLSCL